MLKVDNICQSLNGFWLPVTLSGERQDTLSAGSTPRWVMATCFLALWLPLHSVWHSASWSAKLLPSDSVSSHLSHATKSWPLKSDVSWSFCTVPPLGPRNRVPDPPLWFLRANQNVCCCPCWRQTKDIQQWKRPTRKLFLLSCWFSLVRRNPAYSSVRGCSRFWISFQRAVYLCQFCFDNL